MSTKLSKAQNNVLSQMRNGSIIGELSDKFNGRYELFTRKPNWVPKTNHPLESPFVAETLNKNTVFALLTLGLIRKKDIREAMWPFGRDVWYVFNLKN